MDVKEFRKKVTADSIIVADGKKLKILEIVKFRLSDGSFYMKCFLEENRVIADDLGENIFIFVHPIKPYHKDPPFQKQLGYQGKKFNFLYEAHAVAEKVWGSYKFFKVGDSERFWDFKAKDGSYLSLGIEDSTGERMDLVGRILQPNQVELEG
jgi:hypothetical protein